MRIIERIVIFITRNKICCNGITKHIHKFGCEFQYFGIEPFEVEFQNAQLFSMLSLIILHIVCILPLTFFESPILPKTLSNIKYKKEIHWVEWWSWKWQHS